jgi:CheY-like chemotaxis protein
MKDKIDILYVEDNEDYISFVKRAISKIDDKVQLQAVTDGNAALDFFKQENDTRSLKLILMDINLPGITGIELVKKIRQKEGMEFTPIIMFSTSDNPADVKKSYDSGANAYVVKPIGISPLVNSLRSMCDFWLGCNYTKN